MTAACKNSRIRSVAILRKGPWPNSPPMTSASGVKTDPLGAIRPTAMPPHMICPVSDNVKIWCVPDEIEVRRRSTSGPTAFCAAAARACASRLPSLVSDVNFNPSKRPIRTSSTYTSPVSLMVTLISNSAPMPFNSLRVRRSTKRAVNASCSASDSLSSTSLA